MVEYGTQVLEGGHLTKLGNDVWAFLEQVAIAALDMGKVGLAEVRPRVGADLCYPLLFFISC